MGQHSCGCCSLKAGCRLGAIWTMIEAICGLVILVITGLLGQGNILSIAAACVFVIVFCSAWVLLAGIFREVAEILFAWSAIYVVFVLIRIVLLGFAVTAYSQYVDEKPVTFDVLYLTDGTRLSQRPDSVHEYLPYVIGFMGAMAVSIILSAWIFIGVIYLGVDIRQTMWKRARGLEGDGGVAFSGQPTTACHHV